MFYSLGLLRLFAQLPANHPPVQTFPVERLPIEGVAIEPLPIEQTTVIFSSPNFILALIAGVIMAFAFQLLLTNLAIAAVVSPGGSVTDDDESLGHKIRGVETKVGWGLLLSVSTALFTACFFAVKLSMVGSQWLGAITAITIWSAFFFSLVLLSSTAVSSLLGTLVRTAASGLQGVMGTATSLVGANIAKNQAIATAEDITAAVRRELTAGLDAESIQQTLQKSVSQIKLPKLDLSHVGSQFEKFLQDADLKEVADGDLLKNVDRQTFINLVSSRTDLSKQEIDQVADQLEKVWQSVLSDKGDRQQTSRSQLLGLLKTATSPDLNANDLVSQLEKLSKGSSSSGGLTSQALQLGGAILLNRVLQNTDFSKLDVDKISGQLRSLRDNLGSSLNLDASRHDKPFSAIQSDIEDYLLFSEPWKLNRETVKKEFKNVIYDPEASPDAIRQELDLVNRDYFVQVLSLREDFTSEAIQDLANELDTIRSEVFSSVQLPEGDAEAQQSQSLRSRVENYLRSTGQEELNPEAIEQEFKTLLEDPGAGIEALGNRLRQFDRDTLTQLLQARQDIDSDQINQLVDRLESVRDRVLSEAKDLQDRAQTQAQELREKLEAYLRNTQKEELNPEGIERDLKTLFEDPSAGLSALRTRLSQFDRDTLVQLLSQRQDLSEEQVNRILDQIESIRDRILNAFETVRSPRRLASRLQQQVVSFESSLEDYLRNTQKEELNPEGIKRDLQTLLQHPQAGLSSLGDRISQFDRGTLVALLSQREDISEEEANRIADQVESSYHSIVGQIQKVQQTVQSTIDGVLGRLRDYLNALERPELNYEGIQQDFAQLFNDPQVGFEALRDRLSHFDRQTLVAVLSSREDISEEDANRIIDRLESTRDQALHQAERVQQETQKRLKLVKEQAQKQVVETQKIAAGAAWWLFSTGVVSLAASAIAGIIAVDNLHIL
jgi:ElaB/YqjD/DUF883 family membrane-anchored ribosome-binding protein